MQVDMASTFRAIINQQWDDGLRPSTHVFMHRLILGRSLSDCRSLRPALHNAPETHARLLGPRVTARRGPAARALENQFKSGLKPQLLVGSKKRNPTPGKGLE